jgi:hypothetical protein
MKKIFFTILFTGFFNFLFASFPISEINPISEMAMNSESSLFGNLSLIFSIISAVSLATGLPIIFSFLCLPAVILGAMSLNTKGRIQGLIGLIIGLIEILFLVVALVIVISIIGWF